MNEQAKKSTSRKALIIGIVFCLSYLGSYYIRKLLGLVRTDLLDGGFFEKVQLDGFQSLYMAFYAAGQLINGIIGDFLPPRRMITLGFLLAGASIIVFPLSEIYWISLLCFAVFGYGLSMIRGPIMKLISENTEPKQARLICTFFCFTCHFAVFIATLFVMLFQWKEAFVISGIITLAFAVLLWIFIFVMEKRGDFRPLVAPSERTRPTVKGILSIFTLPGFVFFLFIGGIVETSATTITYWLPSFIEGYLGQTTEFSNIVTSTISVVTAVCSFAALLLYQLSHGRTKLVILILFSLSALCFLTVLLIGNASIWVSLIALLLALLLIGCVSSLLWSIYIPSLGKTGKVSGANGVLDCFGYLFASGANILFSALAGDADNPTWDRLIFAWIGLAVIGILLAVLKKDPPPEEEQ